MERSLCQGLTRVLLALRLSKVLEVPPLPFNKEQNRFEQRFLAFCILDRPEPLDYLTFQSSTLTGQGDPSKVHRPSIHGRHKVSVVHIRSCC